MTVLEKDILMSFMQNELSAVKRSTIFGISILDNFIIFVIILTKIQTGANRIENIFTGHSVSVRILLTKI